MQQSYESQHAQFWTEVANSEPGWVESFWDNELFPTESLLHEALAAEKAQAEAKAAKHAQERVEWLVMQEKHQHRLRKEQAEKDRSEADKQWTNCGAGMEYLNCRLASFKAVTDDQKKALEICEDFPFNGSSFSMRNLWLLGPVGTGKTHLAIATLRRELDEGNAETVAFVTQRNLTLEIRASWDGDKSVRGSREVIKHYGTVDVLVLDDIGASHGREAEQNDLLAVIDLRSQNGLMTIITSNLTPQQLRAALGDRSYSRLRNRAVLATLTGPDVRVGGVPALQAIAGDEKTDN
jgi:DNA replication protein DnaC